MNVVLIHNAKGGSSKPLRELKAVFKQYGIQVGYSFTVSQLGSRKLAALIEDGVTIAVYGGDGTINSAARLLVGTKAALLPLPGGTFNHFVRDLGMSADMEEILANVKRARRHKVDVAYVNDELFLNNSNIGMYPFSLITRKRAKRIFGKWPAAILAAFDQMVAFRRHRLVIDGVRVRSPFVLVGNNEYEITNALMPQRTQLDRGLLSVMVATSATRFGLMKVAFAVALGKAHGRDDFSHETRKTIRIDSPRSQMLVSLDGEVRHLTPPLLYRSHHRALTVLHVPPGK